MVDGRFFAHSFWKVERTVHIHVNSCVDHLWLPCRMVGRGAFRTENSESSKNFKFFFQVVGSISGHIGSHEW